VIRGAHVATRTAPTRTLTTSSGRLEYLVTGTGSPVTVFAHGLGGSIADTRPLGSGVAGTRVFFHFRGHGGSTAQGVPWTYEELAAELRAVADHTEATRALGVSMGASALLRLLASTPDRFERLVFFLPAALDRPRPDSPLARYRAVAEREGVDRVEELMLATLPPALGGVTEARTWVRGQAERLASPSLAGAFRSPLASPAGHTSHPSHVSQAPLTDKTALARVTVPALVIGQLHDPIHPAGVAADLAAALPAGQLRVFATSPALWLARRELRGQISRFLNDQAV
jgi:3-oxoadipate enol-lactonase